MAYHGYICFISNYAKTVFENKKTPIKILEIGVDTGITLFSLNNNLNMLNTPFEYKGIDILIQPHIDIMKYTFLQANKNKIELIQENSLSYLEKCNEVFDIILIDGDHNYKTVIKELSYLDNISHKNTLVVCDDYFGRWSKKDLYYSEREAYQENKIATPKEESEKQGVGTAIDEFLQNNKYNVFTLFESGEPICLIKKENEIIGNKSEES
tara:strand:- start:16353 stop:16985 length:633 start_codon:yes stop_codon:yes gene_type:complete